MSSVPGSKSGFFAMTQSIDHLCIERQYVNFFPTSNESASGRRLRLSLDDNVVRSWTTISKTAVFPEYRRLRRVEIIDRMSSARDLWLCLSCSENEGRGVK